MVNNYIVPMGEISKVENKLTIVKANNEFVYDENNKKYLDLRSGLWNSNLGNNVELLSRIESSFKKQFSAGITSLDIHSFHHPMYQLYASKLLNFVDKDNFYTKLIYTNSGSECTELSLKLARQISKKKKTLSFSKGYHGTFWGGMSVSGLDQEVTKVYNSKIGNIDFIDFPETEEEEEKLLNYINNNHQNYGAMMIEPVIGSGGIKIASLKFMNKLGRLLKEKDIAIIFDEVATGFYRTGSAFYFHKLDFYPDIINLSKGINNGVLPFGTVILSEKVIKSLKDEQLEHFSTQNGNLLGIISSYETLDYYIKNEATIKENIVQINMTIISTLEEFGLEYREIGGMIAIPINHVGKLLQVTKDLEGAGILTYYYMNSDKDNGLTLMPSYYTDLLKLKKAINYISKVVMNYA